MVWFKNAHIRVYTYAMNNANLEYYKKYDTKTCTPLDHFWRCIQFGVHIARDNYPTIFTAVDEDNLTVLRWLLSISLHEFGDHTSLVKHAADRGNIRILQWLHHMYPNIPPYCALDCAAKNGHMETINWVLQHYPTAIFTAYAMNDAASNGYLSVVEWLHSHGEMCTTAAMNGAAGNGHLHVVKWLHTHRTEGCTTYAINSALRNGQYDCVLWLHEYYPYNFDTHILVSASNKADMQIIKWIYKNYLHSCKLESVNNAIRIAAKNGHYDAVQYFVSHHIEDYIIDGIHNAHIAGHDKIEKYLRSLLPEDLRIELSSTN